MLETKKERMNQRSARLVTVESTPVISLKSGKDTLEPEGKGSNSGSKRIVDEVGLESISGGDATLQSPPGAASGEAAEAEEDDINSKGLAKKVSGTQKDRFMVHNAGLYVDLLDGSDWTEVIRAEKRRKKREALALHWEEEANERDMRDALRKKGAEDAKAVKAARRKILKAAKEEREEMAFRARNDAFFARYRNIVEMWEPMERNIKVYHDRVREQIFRNWEKEVFLPSQREINRKVEEKCAEDTRPHLFSKQAKKEMEDVERKGSWDTNQSGSVSSPWSSWSFSLSGRKGVPLTWKEKKDELWKSFLYESNRKNKVGGRSGLFLDVIDEVEYDPIAQRDADTIYYKKRTLPTGDVDQRRAEAKQIEAQYRRLAFSYRDLESKSCTGVLRDHSKETPFPSFSSQISCPITGGEGAAGMKQMASSCTMTGGGKEGSSKTAPVISSVGGVATPASLIRSPWHLQPCSSPPPPPPLRIALIPMKCIKFRIPAFRMNLLSCTNIVQLGRC